MNLTAGHWSCFLSVWDFTLLLLNILKCCFFCGCFSVSTGRVRVKRTVIQTDRMTFGAMRVFIQESNPKLLYFCNLMYSFSECNKIFNDIYRTSLDLINQNLIVSGFVWFQFDFLYYLWWGYAIYFWIIQHSCIWGKNSSI